MTAQAREKLLYEGKEFWMACEPFSQYINKNKIDILLESPSSALWRGYNGEWEIFEGKLFLTKISGHGKIKNEQKFKQGRLELRKKMKKGEITPQQNGELLKSLRQDCFEDIELSLNSLFSSNSKVFADWYTGTIRCPYGDLINYIHLGYESVYSNELIIEIDKGVLVEINGIKI